MKSIFIFFISYLVVAQSDLIFVSSFEFKPGLNDTGISWAGNYPSGNSTTCQSNIISPQDCNHGRDFTHNSDDDGVAGFNFTKLDSNGIPLENQNVEYSNTPWFCVRDNVTGLIWEVKTDNGGLHDKDDEFTWYNSDPATNGGGNGVINEFGDICFGYDFPDSSSYCNTESFTNRVNEQGLCGLSNWRIPDINDLVSIAYLGSSTSGIDTEYFPNTVDSYWSQTPGGGMTGHNSLIVGFSIFGYGSGGRDNPLKIRLVSGGNDFVINQWDDNRYVDNGDGTVLDIETSLVWKLCAEGLSGPTCDQGVSTTHDFANALIIAESSEFAGFTNWRLPNIKELTTLAAFDRINPSINEAVFPNTPADHFWSSSPVANGTVYSHTLNFSGGYSGTGGYSRTTEYYVRLVREQ